MDGPIIQDPLPNVRASVGAPLRLECRVAGHNLEIKWLHNSAPINEAGGIKIIRIDSRGVAAVEIANFQTHLAGIYTMSAKNEGGQVYTSCEVHIT